MSHKKLNATAEKNTDVSSENNEADISQVYEKLNDKCDKVISKIKNRKENKINK